MQPTLLAPTGTGERSPLDPDHRDDDRPDRAAWWNLSELHDADRAAVLSLLGAWVDWLVDRYDLRRVIPECWPRHGAMVEDLLALRLAWQAAYENPKADPGQPLQWHVWLDLLLGRVERRWDAERCKPTKCMLAERQRIADELAVGDEPDRAVHMRPGGRG